MGSGKFVMIRRQSIDPEFSEVNCDIDLLFVQYMTPCVEGQLIQFSRLVIRIGGLGEVWGKWMFSW